MFIRFLTGRRKGEVEEMKFADAELLLADGRAERAYAEEPVAAPKPAPAKPAAPRGPFRAKKRL